MCPGRLKVPGMCDGFIYGRRRQPVSGKYRRRVIFIMYRYLGLDFINTWPEFTNCELKVNEFNDILHMHIFVLVIFVCRTGNRLK